MIIYVMSEGTKEEKLKHIFRIFDRDGSGSICDPSLQSHTREGEGGGGHTRTVFTENYE